MNSKAISSAKSINLTGKLIKDILHMNEYILILNLSSSFIICPESCKSARVTAHLGGGQNPPVGETDGAFSFAALVWPRLRCVRDFTQEYKIARSNES